MKTIEPKDGKVVLVDQTRLPVELKYVECEEVEGVAEAIEGMRIRGAPAIGVAAALGLYLTALRNAKAPREQVLKELEKSTKRLLETRPTAVNLSWAVERVMGKARGAENSAEAAVKEALSIYHEDLEVNRKIGENGAELIEDGDVVLTHCNAGALATSGFGTALGVIKAAVSQGKKVRVFADETRPLLQGARLTSFELVSEGIPVAVIVDGAAAHVMKEHSVTKVIVGADRIAANGDTANKIGTYGLAILAKEHRIPFYVAAPVSTIDCSIESGDKIPIETRDRKEVEFFNRERVVDADAGIFNPAFDVTPARYIRAIITEGGIIKQPLGGGIRKIYDR